MRESYRTEAEAIKARDRWLKLGYTAYISDKMPKIPKFTVEIDMQSKRGA